MYRRLAASLLAGAMAVLSPSIAMAACGPDDLAGRWDSYTVGNTEDEPFWERCEIRLGSTGKILRRELQELADES